MAQTQDTATDAATAAAALAEDLLRVLRQLFRRLRRESEDAGISLMHLLLLATIRERPGIGVGELARLENLRGPTISGHVKALEALGFVARVPADPHDRRRVGLVLTEKGRDTIATLKRSRSDWLARKLAGLPPDARDTIRAAIAPLNEIVQ